MESHTSQEGSRLQTPLALADPPRSACSWQSWLEKESLWVSTQGVPLLGSWRLGRDRSNPLEPQPHCGRPTGLCGVQGREPAESRTGPSGRGLCPRPLDPLSILPFAGTGNSLLGYHFRGQDIPILKKKKKNLSTTVFRLETEWRLRWFR